MKKAFLYTLAGFAALITVLLITASMQPTQWQIERSILINAPRETVWTLVSDLHRYNDWNPYARMDPSAKTVVEGAAATVGSSYSWDGEQTGAGRMTTTEVKPGERVDFKLEFLRPMAVTNSASFLVSGEEGWTKMTWTMSGKHEGMLGLIARVFHLFMNMDEMVGKPFESGLTALKEIMEKEASPIRDI